MKELERSLLFPMVTYVLWILLVWIWLYVTRLSAMKKGRVPVQDLADPQLFDQHLGHVANPSDHFENQFELPVLFFFGILLAVILGWADSTYVSLAWFFVITRVLHSGIHLTYNRIKHRFAAYLLGAIALWWFWVRLAIQLITQTE